MKKTLAVLLLTSAAVWAAPQQQPAKPVTKPFMKPAAAPSDTPRAPDIDVNAISETFGHMLVTQLKASPLKLNVPLVVKGMQDELSGKGAPMTQEAYDKAVTILQQNVLTEMGANNLAQGAAFLKDNAKKEGVVTLVDGKLQYRILQKGSGATVGPHDTPQIQYEGTFIDGRVFGTSYNTNEPVWLPLDQAIPGFAQGIVGMKEGEKRQLYVAPDMAYGPNGTANIPPNATLIFTVEVVKANKS